MWIYKITNILNNKIYIGQTNNYRRRFNEHKSSLRRNKHQNKCLQEDYNKCGFNYFTFELLEQCNTKSEAIDREDYWINYYGGINSSSIYNECDKSGHNTLYKQNQAKAQLNNHKITTQGKLNISKAHKGKKLSQQQINHIKQNAKNNPNYGMKNKTHSIESRNKMSLAKKGKYDRSSNPNFKYSIQFVNKLRKKVSEGYTYKQLSEIYNLKRSTISYLINRSF